MAGSYKTKSGVKAERKQGLKAVANLNDNPNWPRDKILATAQQYEKTFSDIDEYDDALFCDTMETMRNQDPDLYAVFWWWRLAHEHAAKTAEDEGEAKPETRYRTFMVTQFMAPPFSDAWEDDRKTLKPGITPLITDEIILDGLDHRTIKRWAYVWHDRDVYTEEDEITDRDQLRKAGERKFKHVHVMLDIPAKVPVSTVARWFNVPPQQVDIMRGRGSFLDGVEYLVHESPNAVAQGKTHYDDDEVYATEGFDFRKEITDLQAHRAKFGKRAGEMSPADTMRMHVMQDGWTMRQCRDDDPLTYAKIRNTLPPLRLDYLLDSEPCPFRLNIYIDGPGSIGKSALSEYLAEALFSNADKSFFTIGGDDRVTFDGYDGEPVIIWDDMRVTDFVRQFTSNGTYRILDPHPRKIAQQAKHSRVILTNAINIINGVQPYEEFIDGLAGTYRDKYGVQHEAEDENQAWRRFPMIICIREQDFDVLINKGFVNNDLRSIKSMQVYSHVRGSMKAIQERLGGVAREQVLVNFAKPVLEAKAFIDTSHDKKITDPEQIPAEFADYGKLIPEEEYQAELRKKLLDSSRKAAIKRSTEMIKGVRWLWLSQTRNWHTYYWYCTRVYRSVQPMNSMAAEEYAEFMCRLDYRMLYEYMIDWYDMNKLTVDVSIEEFGNAFLYFWMWCCNADNARAHLMDAPDEPLSDDEARQLLADMGLDLTDEVITGPATNNTTFSPETIDWKEIKRVTPFYASRPRNDIGY